MKVGISLQFEGADLAQKLLTTEDLRAIGDQLADEQRARTATGVDANGQPIKRGPTGQFLRRTGRMLDTLGRRRTTDRQVTIGSRAPYADRVNDRVPFLGLDPEELAADVAERMEQNLARAAASGQGDNPDFV